MTWPTTNPARGTYQWLRLAVGQFLKYGPDVSTWDHDQDQFVDYLVQNGVAEFYVPPVDHEWSFLRVGGSITTSNTDYDYDLPADFGTIIDDVTYDVDGGQKRLKLISEHAMRAKQATDDATGSPTYITIRPKAIDLTAVQGWEAVLYPTPDATLTIKYRYHAVPAVLTTSNLYPLGTNVHAETIKASCLACAECETSGPGKMHERYMARLQASIAIDTRSSIGTDAKKPFLDLAESGAGKGKGQ